MSQKKTWGWYLVIFLSLFPVILWLMAAPLEQRFGNLSASLLSLGQLCGLVGACFFAFNFILAARLKFLERSFGGLNKVFVAHHVFGGVAFILLLLHPVLITAQYLPISWEATRQFTLSLDNWARNYGRLALLTMIGVLFFTYYVPLKYQVWKLTHHFIGLAVFFALIHAFLIPSDVSRYWPLHYYILIMLTLGLAAFCYRVLFGKYLVTRYRYEISAIRKFPRGITEVVLQPLRGSLQFRPGQFAFLSFVQDGISPEYHPFSITADSGSGTLSFGMKALGDFTDTISQLKKGALVKVEGPYGAFYHHRRHFADQVWVAGGIGITPFLSMVRSQPTVDGGQTTLFYSVKTIDEAVFLPELMEFAKSKENFRVILYESQRSGLLTAEKILTEVGESAQTEFFVCGPNSMMSALREQLTKEGVADEHIHTEEFAL